MKRWKAACLVLPLGAIGTPVHAQVPAPQQIQPAQRCSSLPGTDFSLLADAPAQIIEARWVQSQADVPAHCLVKGYVAAHVGFELQLPEDWSGRLFMTGNGGYAGSTPYKPRVAGKPAEDACLVGLRKRHACVQTDTGHLSTMMDGKWAYNNPQAEIDYAYRATHVTNVAAKGIIKSYYGKGPAKSYFMGCSYGGEQAMVIAQRFPYDFDGIVAEGAPVNLSSLMQQNIWMMQHTLDKDWKPIFNQANIELLHSNALAKCDMDDGLKDGIISNPGQCRIDTKALVCKPGQKSGCLSEEKAEAARMAYQGPATSTGKRLTLGGWMPGSELDWINVYRWPVLANLGQEYFRFMGFDPDPGPSWKQSSYDFDVDYKRLGVMESLYDTSNPDLRELMSAGAKLMLVSGWNDMGMIPPSLIDYYQTATRVMGGEAETRDFFRLFLIPASRHCTGGEGAFQVDYLSYLEAWVERGKAPDVMIGSHPGGETGPAFTRPHYAYPMMAKYKGSGDANDAANFDPVRVP